VEADLRRVLVEAAVYDVLKSNRRLAAHVSLVRSDGTGGGVRGDAMYRKGSRT
jgi:hypothetical protein